jgi:hypothetical protein
LLGDNGMGILAMPSFLKFKTIPMKKLFHPGIFAIIAFVVSSCSKSANDMVVPEKSPIKESVLLTTGKNVNIPEAPIAGAIKFLNFINQPYEFKLGIPDSYLDAREGESLVFYVVLSSDFPKEEPSNATLTTLDDKTSDIIQECKLISSKEAFSYGIHVPFELSGSEFMFGIVEMNDQYSGRTIALHSEITVNGETVTAQLDHAFSIK